MRLHILGIAGNGAGLPLLILGPSILGRVGNGDDAFPLVVQNFAHVHIESGLIDHGDVRRTVRRHDSAVAGAGNLARKIYLAALGVNILHHQFVRGGIPIDLRFIVKGIVRAAPPSAAVVDFIHGAVLHDRRTVGWTLLRRLEHIIVNGGGISFVAALNQAVHIDIGGGHIDVAPGDIPSGYFGRSRSCVGCCCVTGAT